MLYPAEPGNAAVSVNPTASFSPDDEDEEEELVLLCELLLEFFTTLGGPLYSWNLMILDLFWLLFIMGLLFFFEDTLV